MANPTQPQSVFRQFLTFAFYLVCQLYTLITIPLRIPIDGVAPPSTDEKSPSTRILPGSYRSSFDPVESTSTTTLTSRPLEEPNLACSAQQDLKEAILATSLQDREEQGQHPFPSAASRELPQNKQSEQPDITLPSVRDNSKTSRGGDTHIGDNNSNNKGIIGSGSNNVVNSGNNTGHHMFSNSSHFNINGGEFINSGGKTTKNTYNNYGGTKHYNQKIGTLHGNANLGENQKNDGSTYNRGGK